MKNKTPCEIRQFSDMAECQTCGMKWDVNDPFPPVCNYGENKPTQPQLTPAEQTCLVFAARYAYDLNTGAALMVVNAILQNWDRLAQHTKDQLFREARAVAVYNPDDWRRLYQKYESEKEAS